MEDMTPFELLVEPSTTVIVGHNCGDNGFGVANMELRGLFSFADVASFACVKSHPSLPGMKQKMVIFPSNDENQTTEVPVGLRPWRTAKSGTSIQLSMIRTW